jgi:cathepsin B
MVCLLIASLLAFLATAQHPPLIPCTFSSHILYTDTFGSYSQSMNASIAMLEEQFIFQQTPQQTVYYEAPYKLTFLYNFFDFTLGLKLGMPTIFECFDVPDRSHFVGNEPCPLVPQLKCDHWSHANSANQTTEWWLVSGSNIPQRQQITIPYGSSMSEIVTFDFIVFDPTKPDPSVFVPPPTVQVLDLSWAYDSEAMFTAMPVSRKMVPTEKASVQVNDPDRISTLQQRASFTVGANPRFNGLTIADSHKLLRNPFQARFTTGRTPHRVPTSVPAPSFTAPASFDARTQWGALCPSIGTVFDQGQCGSCWAFGAAESLSDRFCIASHGAQKPHLSPEWMVSCYRDQGGCGGGNLDTAWKDMVTTGLVEESCFPYTAKDEMCPYACKDGSPLKMFYSKDAFTTLILFNRQANVASIQQELMTNGPLEVAFWVFDDFFNYQGGIYSLSKGSSFMGGHAVKLVGWGTENGVDYWTIINSWAETWGEKGLFRIRRGSDECGIEDEVTTGHPKI